MKALMYHYVREGSSDLPHFRYLHIDDFRLQLDFLQREFHFLNVEDFVGVIKGERAVDDSVVLTFDDGFKDHCRYVLPELLERGLWGIFYIPTGMHVSRRLLNVHRIHYLTGKFGGQTVLEALREVIEPHMIIEDSVQKFSAAAYRRQSNDEYTTETKKILNYFVSPEWQSYLLDVLMSGLETGDESVIVDEFYLAADEIKELEANGMIVGSHSVTHPVLSKLSVSEQTFEIKESFSWLEKATDGLRVRSFCYPYGGKLCFTEETEIILKGERCLFAFDFDSRSMRDITDDDVGSRPLALPRYDCNVFPHGTSRTGTGEV